LKISKGLKALKSVLILHQHAQLSSRTAHQAIDGYAALQEYERRLFPQSPIGHVLMIHAKNLGVNKRSP
jgi:ABC-type uncharacterized transport system permease subunit